ncbi:hypothetical protein R80B4_02525 [Fibrobacteres bacterium R8-0-B4]
MALQPTHGKMGMIPSSNILRSRSVCRLSTRPEWQKSTPLRTPMPLARTQLPMIAPASFSASIVIRRLETSKAAILMKGTASG